MAGKKCQRWQLFLSNYNEKPCLSEKKGKLTRQFLVKRIISTSLIVPSNLVNWYNIFFCNYWIQQKQSIINTKYHGTIFSSLIVFSGISSMVFHCNWIIVLLDKSQKIHSDNYELVSRWLVFVSFSFLL